MRATIHPALRLLASLALVMALSAEAHEANCRSSTPSEATVAARKLLEENSKDLDARLKLADALIADSCFDEAVHTLEEGEALHGRNTELQSRLREARSMTSEQSYFEGLNRAEESAKLSRNLLRCSKLADVPACDEALSQKPDDPEVLVAKADALVRTRHLSEALRTYGRARELAPDTAMVDEKIAAAQAQRRTFLDTCQNTSGEAALQACDAIFARGGEDEFAILKRKGVLLQATNQPSLALDAYVAANMLKHGDRSVALAIVALTDSTQRKDALALAARGSALLTLGRAKEALEPLQQALALSQGGLPEVKSQLARAERLAKSEERRQAGVTTVAQSALASAESTRRYSNTAPVTRSN